jgi:hypothetical protein
MRDLACIREGACCFSSCCSVVKDDRVI